MEVHALRGVDLELTQGELVVLLGPSGSGKSTLLNILGGLDVPTSGRVYFNGTEVTAADEAALTRFRRDHVGFVFQFYNLIPSLTARENVALVTEIARQPMKPAAALEIVGLGERITFPRSSPAASSNASPSRALSQNVRIFCSATSRRVRWTAPRGFWCWRRSSWSTASSARPRR